ncbi:MAG: LCP family protein [Patescibacteria group bacterium]
MKHFVWYFPQHLHFFPKLQRSDWHRFLFALLALTLFTISATATFTWLSLSQMIVNSTEEAPSALPQSAEPTPEPTPDPLAAYGIALLGHGDPGHDGGLLTDSIMVAYVQPREERVTLISLPRDIWVELPLLETDEGLEYKGYKINAAYAIGTDQRQYPNRPKAFTGEAGGGTLAKYAIEQVTGLHIPYFLAVNFSAFETAIDQLGGITVTVPRGFVDDYYPIPGEEENTCDFSEEDIEAITATVSGEQLERAFPCRYERLVFEAGTHTLDGETALKFARSRHSEQSGGDFARAARQQAVVQGIKQQVINLNFIPKIPGLLQTLSWNVTTDIQPSQLEEWIDQSDELQTYPFSQIVLSTQNVLKDGRSGGQYVLLPAEPAAGEYPWLEVHQWIQTEIDSTDL